MDRVPYKEATIEPELKYIMDLYEVDVFKEGREKYEDLEHEWEQLIDLLIEDCLIEEHSGGFHDGLWALTVKGKLFEGFEERTKRETEESTTLRNLREQTVDLQKSIRNLTRWIALGTLIAAAYYSKELYNYFYPS